MRLIDLYMQQKAMHLAVHVEFTQGELQSNLLAPQ